MNNGMSTYPYRDQARMGQFLRDYELARHPLSKQTDAADRTSEMRSIIVPTAAKDFPDLSFYQGNINWDVMRSKTDTVILRIGQNTWQDSEFENNYTEARKRNFIIGGYFFYDSRATPRAQADVVKAALQGKTLEMELITDWEESYGGQYTGLTKAVEFMKYTEENQGRIKDVGMYTGYYYFIDHSNPTANASEYAYLKTKPLWEAWYADASSVKIPAPWTLWTHWQYATTPDGEEYGVETAEIDHNKFNGDSIAFDARYRINGGVTPMTDYMKVTVDVLNIRDMNNNDYFDFNLLANDIVHSLTTKTENALIRHKIDEIYRGGVLVWKTSIGEWWAAEKSGTTIFMTPADFVPPSTGGGIDPADLLISAVVPLSLDIQGINYEGSANIPLVKK